VPSSGARHHRTGRTRQKERTRAALLDAARQLLAQGRTPTVEDGAEAAGISRATAYRYFANQRALLVAAHPEITATTLLGAHPPADPRERRDARRPTSAVSSLPSDSSGREALGAVLRRLLVALGDVPPV